MGTSLTCFGGSSTFFQAEYMRQRRKLCLPLSSRQGFLVLIPTSVWQTRWTASSAERARLGLPLGEMHPSHHRSANVWRRGTGSATSKRFRLTASRCKTMPIAPRFSAFLLHEGGLRRQLSSQQAQGQHVEHLGTQAVQLPRGRLGISSVKVRKKLRVS